MSKLTMKLSGSATIPMIAERAVLELDVSYASQVQTTAFEQVTSTARGIQRLLRQYSPVAGASEEEVVKAAIAKWSMGKMKTGSFVTDEDSKWRRPEEEDYDLPPRTKLYTASASFSMRVRDFSKLGFLTQTFSQMKNVKIQPISWILTAQTRKAHKSELRKLAAKDALLRAKDYSEALGVGNVFPIELNEMPDYGHGNGPRMMQAQQMQQMQIQRPNNGGGGAGVDGVDLHFEPDEIQMSMSVEMKFEAE